MAFDPFAAGAATEVLDRPKDAAPEAFDPFAAGSAQAHVPEAAAEGADPGPNNAPNVGTEWTSLYAGLDGMDERLRPEQRAVFQRLDAVSDNSKAARAQAINQAYIAAQHPELSHAAMERNWPAIRTAYAQQQFGLVDKDVPDMKLYQSISKRLGEQLGAEGTGTLKPWTWQDAARGNLHDTTKAISGFWESINKPLIEIPEAPKDLPDIPGLGIYNPALAGGIANALRPLVEGLESPLGIGTMGAGAVLKNAAAEYPLARQALLAMGGVFTGLMGYGTAKAAIEAPKVLRDPNASFQDKVTAVASPVADAAATLVGALGTAMEMFPKERAAVVAKELEGKNPAQAAEILRREAAETDVPTHSDFLMDAAHELDRIATVKDKAEVKQAAEAKVEPVDIGKRDETVSAGTGVATPHEEQMIADWKKQIAEETGKPVDKPAEAEQNSLRGTISIKNEAIDAELKDMGLPPATHDEKVTFKGEMAKAEALTQEDPMAGQKLVDELAAKSRPVTATEDALLLREMNRLRLERDAAEAEFIGQSQVGDAADMMDAQLRIARARDAFQKAAEVVTKVGTKNAQALALRRMMVKEDYSLAAIERKRVVANKGKPLTNEQQAEVRDLHKKLTEAQQKIDRYEDQRRAARAAPVKEAPKTRPPPSKARQFLSDQAQAARERIKARMASGKVSSGIDPTDLADYAIVGADYIAKGATKFADWSVAMVNELGEAIRPHLQEIFKQAIQAKDDGTKLRVYKSRLETATKKMQDKLAAGDTTRPERRPLPLDREAIRLKTEYERAKRKVDLSILQAENVNRTPVEKVRSAFQKWVRLGALSYPTVFVKLTSAAMARFVGTPLEQLVGLASSKLMPRLAERARMEGVPTAGGMIRAESKAITEGLTTGMKAAFDMLRNRDSDLTALLEQEKLPPELIEYLGKLHGAFKAPAQVADFARRLQLVTEADLRAGVDVTNPVDQLRLMHEAWTYSKRAIFLQDNGVVNAYKAAIRSLEAKQKATGKPSVGLQLLSTGIQAELPIVKVPTNVVFEINEAVTGALRGPARAAWAYYKGIENLSPGEADQILRLIKKGSLGAAFLALGYFKAKDFGGFHQQGEHRKPKELQAGEMNVEGLTVPRAALHNTYAEVAQYGATVRRVSDAMVRSAGGKPKGPLAGILGASIGLLDEIPFVRETSTLEKYSDSRRVLSAVDAKAASILIPGIVQWLAAQTDKKSPFSPTETARPRYAHDLPTFLEKATPGLREKLPARNPSTTLRQ